MASHGTGLVKMRLDLRHPHHVIRQTWIPVQAVTGYEEQITYSSWSAGLIRVNPLFYSRNAMWIKLAQYTSAGAQLSTSCS